MRDTPRYMAPYHVARIIGVTPETVRRACRGECPSGRIGPPHSIERDALGRWKIAEGAVWIPTSSAGKHLGLYLDGARELPVRRAGNAAAKADIERDAAAKIERIKADVRGETRPYEAGKRTVGTVPVVGAEPGKFGETGGRRFLPVKVRKAAAK